jgi:hypothetical protein
MKKKSSAGPHLSQLSQNLEPCLIVLPWQQRAPWTQVNKVMLGIAAHDQSHAGCALGRRVVQIRPYLDEPAAVGSADAARHACEGLAVFERKTDTTAG